MDIRIIMNNSKFYDLKNQTTKQYHEFLKLITLDEGRGSLCHITSNSLIINKLFISEVIVTNFTKD